MSKTILTFVSTTDNMPDADKIPKPTEIRIIPKIRPIKKSFLTGEKENPKDLKDFLEKHCEIEIYTPEYSFGNLYEWHRKTNKRVSLNENVKFETKINKKLDAKTVVLTIK